MLRAVQEIGPVDDGLLSNEGGLVAFAAAVAVLVVAGVALLLWLLVRHVRSSRHLPASAPLAQRLQELDELHRRGVISDTEHAAARRQVLTSS